MSGRVFGYTFGRVPTWLLDAEVSDRAVRLFALLTRYADQEGRSFPGRRALAERLRCSVDSIDRALRELVGAGAVRIEERWDVDGDGGQVTNDYHLLEHRHEDPSRTGAAPPSRTGAAPPGRSTAAPPAAAVRPRREREPEEQESDPDGEDPCERSAALTPVELDREPLGVREPRLLEPTHPGAQVDPAVLIAAIDEAAHRVGESDLQRTATALYGIALRESRDRVGDPLRAVATAYVRGAAEAVDEVQVRGHRAGCVPVRDLPALAFHIARRQLSGEGPPPWPERPRRPSRSAPSAAPPSRGAPRREGAVDATRELIPEPPPEREVPASVPLAAWDALDATQRAAAEAVVQQEQPELARWTHAQGAIWHQAVIAAAARLTAGALTTGATTTARAMPPTTTGAPLPVQEEVVVIDLTVDVAEKDR